MKIRFRHPASVRLEVLPGDELVVQALTPALEALLLSERIDREHICELVREAPEFADPVAADELAVTTRSRRR